MPVCILTCWLEQMLQREIITWAMTDKTDTIQQFKHLCDNNPTYVCAHIHLRHRNKQRYANMAEAHSAAVTLTLHLWQSYTSLSCSENLTSIKRSHEAEQGNPSLRHQPSLRMRATLNIQMFTCNKVSVDALFFSMLQMIRKYNACVISM